MKFLVTGGSGFVGGNLARHLRERGHDVRALVRKTSARTELDKWGCTFAEGELSTGEGLKAAVAGVDCVLHVAGATKGRAEADYVRVNVDGTRNLMKVLAELPSPPRLVLCSSLAAAGPAAVGRPRTESDAPAPLSVYGRSKLAGEQVVRDFAHRVPSVIVRPPTVYGPADKEFLGSVLPMGKLGIFLKPGFGPRQLSLIHVEDLCAALLAAAQTGRTVVPGRADEGTYYVSDGREYHLEEFCAAVAKVLGRSSGWVIPVPGRLTYLVGWGSEMTARLMGKVSIMNRDKAHEMVQEAWTCSTARAREELAFSPRYTLEQGLAQSVEWFRKEGLL